MKLAYKFHWIGNSEVERLCRISNNLYNQALYVFREHLRNTGEYLFYNDLDKIMKETYNLDYEINYRLLKAQCSQQVLRLLEKDIKSYRKSIKDYKKHPWKYKGEPEMPNFKKRGSKFSLFYTNQCCSIKNGYLILSKDTYIPIPQYAKYQDLLKNMKQSRVNPRNGEYVVEIIYEKEDCTTSHLDYNKWSSIDLGVNNLATLLSEDFCVIYNGKGLKSYNRFFNKSLSKLNSIKDKQGIKHTTKRIEILYDKRNKYMCDIMHKISRSIVDRLVQNNIGNLVVGYNKGWKQGINIGKTNNQKFTYLPFARLIKMLDYKCSLSGINFKSNEESYTSKCDSLALESAKKHDSYKGKRIKRGLFRSSTNKVLNADVNGSLNILRKVVGDSDEVIQRIIDRGLLFNPVRIRSVFSNEYILQN